VYSPHQSIPIINQFDNNYVIKINIGKDYAWMKCMWSVFLNTKLSIIILRMHNCHQTRTYTVTIAIYVFVAEMFTLLFLAVPCLLSPIPVLLHVLT